MVVYIQESENYRSIWTLSLVNNLHEICSIYSKYSIYVYILCFVSVISTQKWIFEKKREGSHLLNNVVTEDKKGGTDVMTLRSEVNPKGLSAFFTKMCSWRSVRQFH